MPGKKPVCREKPLHQISLPTQITILCHFFTVTCNSSNFCSFNNYSCRGRSCEKCWPYIFFLTTFFLLIANMDFTIHSSLSTWTEMDVVWAFLCATPFGTFFIFFKISLVFVFFPWPAQPTIYLPLPNNTVLRKYSCPTFRSGSTHSGRS